MAVSLVEQWWSATTRSPWQVLTIYLCLRDDANFSTANEVAEVINREWSSPIATVIDGRRVEISVAKAASPSVPALMAHIENLAIEVRRRAKVWSMNERAPSSSEKTYTLVRSPSCTGAFPSK